MSMKKVKAVMESARTGFLATTDGKRPGVRPMSGLTWVGKEIWMATAYRSTKVRDILKRPEVDLCFMSRDGKHVCIAGPCEVSRAARDKALLFRRVPMLASYTKLDDPNYAVLRLRPAAIRLMEPPNWEYVQVLGGKAKK